MEKFKTIEQDIENVSNKEVVKQGCISTVGIGLVVAGVLAAIGGMSFNDPNSSIPTFLFTISVLFLLVGIIKLFVSRSCYVFRPTKSRLKPLTLYFDVHESDALQVCLEMRRFDDLKTLKRQKDNGIKVEAMVAGDNKFVAVQVSEYIPYSYEAVTPVMCYYGDEANKLVDHFRS